MRAAALAFAGYAACASGLACDGRGAPAVHRSHAAAGIEVFTVNPHGAGLRVNVRWVLSPDRRALLVVHDPVAVEADPIPDGFLYANEVSGSVVQIDGVWDVAPSPDWARLAYGRAYVLHARERDTMPAEEWRRVEAELPEDVADRRPGQLRRELEARAFAASGMTLMLGLGLTQVIFLDRLGPGRAAAPTGPTHSLYGWRVRWTPSGDTLGVGTAPRTTYDDAPAARWVLVRPRLWASYRDSLGAASDSSRFAPVPWVEGPTMEIGTPVVVEGRRVLTINGGTVEVRSGQIVLEARGRDGRTNVRVVGPGRPLVATAGGRFVAALVDRPAGERHEARVQLVVYHVPPQ